MYVERQIKLRIASHCLIFSMLCETPTTVGRKPSFSNFRPSKLFNWVATMVKATPEVKPLITGADMKFAMNPTVNYSIKHIRIALCNNLYYR